MAKIKRIYFILKKAYHTFMLLVNLSRDVGGTLVSSFLNYYKRFKGFEIKIIIGYDGFPFLEPLTGIGWYSYNLLKNLSNYENIKINLYGRTFFPEETPKNYFVSFSDFKNIRIRTYGLNQNLFPSRNFWLQIMEKFLTPFFILIDKNDLFFAPNYFPPPLFKTAQPVVATIHDCTFKVYPEYLQKETLENLNRYLPEILYKAEKIISVSKATKQDLIKFFNLREEKIKVIYHGFNPLPLNEKKINEKYLLFVSTLEPRKNLEGILDAFEIIKEKCLPFDLYLIGKIGWKCENILKRIEKNKFKNSIHLLSYMKLEDLGSYYKNAFCLLFPSHYEGFGFPILEAFYFGIPVITTNKSSIPEIGQDGCLYVEGSGKSIAEGVIKLWEDKNLRENLIKKGFQIVKNFNWEKTTKETYETFLKVLI